MRNINSLIAISLLWISTTVNSQTNPIQIYITPTFGNAVLHLADSSFMTNDSANLQIEVLKFYISNIRFLINGKVVLEEKNSFHLVDASQIIPIQIFVDNKQNISFDEIKFDLGIDSATNVSGALGGDLDPTKGMYWTWQSGYINFKLEGTSPRSKTRNHEFTFHLGGYQRPNYCLQTLRFKTNNSSVINLKLDVQNFLNQIDLTKTNHIMSPGNEAVLLSKIVADSFKISEN